MGQPITVRQKATTTPGVVRFEMNRSLTGMGHERYDLPGDAKGDRPPDELARRLFEHGGVSSVHVYSNVVTVGLAPGATGEGLEQVIHDLFIHYVPGVQPPTDEELMSQAPAS